MDKRKRRLLCMLEGGKKYKWIRGAPPLSFKAKKAGTLENYRIYGNTVGGESVGDLIENGEHAGEYKADVTVSNGTDTLTTPIYLPEQIKMVGEEAEYIDYAEQKQHRVRKNLFDYTIHSGNTVGYLWDNGTVETFNTAWRISDYIPCNGTVFTINPIGGNDPAICLYDENKQYIRGKSYNTGGAAFKSAVTIESSTVASYIRFSYKLTGYDDQVDDLTKIMLNSGSEALPYEPYIENTDLDVTLPALPTLPGTNVLSVGTEVQPSKIEVKGKIKAI